MVNRALAERLFADEFGPPVVAERPCEHFGPTRRARTDEDRYRKVGDMARLGVIDRLAAVAVHLGEYDAVVEKHVRHVNGGVQTAAGIPTQVEDYPFVA